MENKSDYFKATLTTTAHGTSYRMVYSFSTPAKGCVDVTNPLRKRDGTVEVVSAGRLWQVIIDACSRGNEDTLTLTYKGGSAHYENKEVLVESGKLTKLGGVCLDRLLREEFGTEIYHAFRKAISSKIFFATHDAKVMP